ncbi:MAG: thiamine pyrophosphate-dependent enzyme [Nitrospinota bacterium]
MKLPHREAYLKTLASVVRDEIAITSLGMATHVWGRLKPKPSNFHLSDSMGQTIPLAAGVALAQPDTRVVVMEGDGGLLMNLGCLATVADLALDNLLILLFENRVYEASGNQLLPGRTADFAELGKAAGIPHCANVERVRDFRLLLDEALRRKATSFLSLKICQETELVFPPYSTPPWEVADNFRRWARKKKDQNS